MIKSGAWLLHSPIGGGRGRGEIVLTNVSSQSSLSTTSSPCAPHVQSNMAGKRKRPLAAKCSAPHRNLHRHREIPLAKREPGESERNPGPEAERSAKGKERGSRVHNIYLEQWRMINHYVAKQSFGYFLASS